MSDLIQEIQHLAKLGIDVTESELVQFDHGSKLDRGTFKINHEVFVPMMHLVNLTDMIVQSKNPEVLDMFNQALTLAGLSPKVGE